MFVFFLFAFIITVAHNVDVQPIIFLLVFDFVFVNQRD